MKAYSIDLRQKIIDAYNKKEGSYRELAKRFSVARSFVQKLLTRYKDTGRVSALPHRGGQKSKIKCNYLEMLSQIIAKKNDATLVELCKIFESKTQIKISKSTMERLLQKLKIVRKKKHFMRRSKIRKLIYLSHISPEFSPIEHCWSKIKEFLRSQAARTYEDLDKAITEALENVTSNDIIGWFTHCGYCTLLNSRPMELL